MKDLSKLFALLMMIGATLTFTACSEDEPVPVEEEELSETAQALVGDWVMNPEAGAFAIGPAEGSAEWWFIDEAGVAARACFFDDVYTFGEDGSFSISLGDQTWLETWQGAEEGCGAPVSPHDGSGAYSFGATETSIIVEGEGAYIGLAKAYNGGELDGSASVPVSRSYKILEFNSESSPKTLKLDITVGEGHWTYNLISQ